MDVNLLTPKRLFEEPVRYVVPEYQRKYVWTQDEQWEPLWNDVLNLADQALPARQHQGEQPASIRPHFLGSIVLMPRDDPLSRISTIEVVDGQQRLLTLQLMLDAAQQACENRHPDTAQAFTALVLQRPEDRDNNGDHDFKMWPADLEDQDAFRHAMRNELSPDGYERERIVAAHDRFVEWIGKWLDEQPTETKQRAIALHSALMGHIKVAVIELDKDDDEQMIFETLNSRGTPLGMFELAKNFLLRQAQEHGTSPALVSSKLKRLQNREGQPNRWWSGEIGSGRARRPRIDAFLHHWLAMETTKEITLTDTFKQFREHVSETRKGEIETIVNELSLLGDKYRMLQTADVSLDSGDHVSLRFSDFVRRWKVLQADVFTPLILWLWVNERSDRRLVQAYKVLESYMIRRLICGLDTRGYGPMGRQLLIQVKDRGKVGTDQIIVTHLAAQRSDRERWPTDSDVAHALVNRSLLGPASAARTRMILEAIEIDFRQSLWRENPADLAKQSLSVEHIMPRQWRTPDWPPPNPDLGDSTENAEAVRTRLVHSIGNLTLVPRRYNSKLSNANWTRKRELYAEEPSDFALNKNLLRPAQAATPRVWDEEQIRKRSERLAKRVIKIWPRPSG